MNNANIGLLFHRKVYDQPALKQRLAISDNNELIFKHNNNKDKERLALVFSNYYEAHLYSGNPKYLKKIENPACSNTFVLFTTYPGLLMGSGYIHETGTQGDFKIGFFFDHTTGQPILPGSSIKGVIKAFLQDWFNAEEHFGFEKIQNLIAETSLSRSTLGELFGTQETEGNAIFYDGVIEASECRNIKLLSNDFITPHTDLLKNPNPNMFLKILPNIAFEFRFGLDKCTDPEKLSDLFKEVLLTVGVGAKTNVGYGQLSQKVSDSTLSSDSTESKTQVQNTPINEDITTFTSEMLPFIVIGTEIDGKIFAEKKDNLLIAFNLNGQLITVKKKKDKVKGGEPAIGNEVKIVISAIPKVGEKDLNFSATVL